MACDICKQNPPGKWYQVVCTTAGERAVEVLCERCHSAPARMGRYYFAACKALAQQFSEATKASDPVARPAPDGTPT